MSPMRPLEAVDWSGLQGPHGPSADLPGLLARLAERPTDDGAWELFHRITHQGTVYPVTPEALPYVLDLISAEPHPVLLTTVHAALTGKGWWQVRHGHGGQAAPDGALEEEARTEAAIQAAVVERRPLLEALCQHEARSVRLNVVPILARLDGEWLAARMRNEPESMVRAAANLALRAAGLPRLVGTTGKSALEHLTVALVCPDDHAEILLSAIGDSSLDKGLPDKWPLDITLQYEAAAALAQCRDPSVLEGLIERFGEYHWTVLIEAGEALLALASRHGQLAQAAATLAETEGFWKDTLRLVRAEALRPYGLPNDRAALRAWSKEG